MKMRKQQFRIGELAKRLDVERFVIRFWEKQFELKPSRSTGKQRYYSELDLEKFTQIKTLLYKRGFTIVGAKQELNGKAGTQSKIIPAATATPATRDGSKELQSKVKELQAELDKQREQFKKKMCELRKQLKSIEL